MTTFERRAWMVAGIILLVWAVIFGAWLMLAPNPPILSPYYP